MPVNPGQAPSRQSTPDAPNPAYSGEKLSLDFQNIDIRTLLQVFADFTRLNVVTSDAVAGTLTLHLKDVPWDQALDIIMQAKNLALRKNGNVLWIAPRNEINAREKADYEAKAQIENLLPQQTQSFQLNYAKAIAVAQGLTGAGQGTGHTGGSATARILGPRGSVLAEPRTNQLFVTDVPSRLAQVAALIKKVDIPMRQVMIEARIVDASDTFSRELGVRLGGGIVNSRSSVGTQPVAANTDTAATFSYTNSNFVNLPAASPNGVQAGAFAVSLFNASVSHLLNLELSALESDGKGKVVSSPRVVTADESTALIEQGTELPYQQATSSGATSVSFRKANLSLEVTPQITPEGNIILTLDVNKDSVGQETTAGFAIDTKHVQTQVRVENGGTVMIGGIKEQTRRNSEDRLPVLGQIPLLGALFRSRNQVDNKTELLIFITPRVVSEADIAGRHSDL